MRPENPGLTYKEYIKTFQWNTLKYSTKRSLMELTALITKNMRQSDEQIKKNLEEQSRFLSQLKQKIASMTKRDQGNLQVRDYTDDIYNKNPNKDLFVESHGSDLFVNMLVVLNQEKAQGFIDNMGELMTEYYSFMDQNEMRKIEDKAKISFNQMKEAKDNKWDEMVAECGDPNGSDFEAKAKEFLTRQMKMEVEQKQRERFPYVLVPGAHVELGVTDKDNNSVYRLVAYKSQADDVVKACRKQGVSARIFNYDQVQYEQDKKNFAILKETYQNKTNTLHKLSSDQFQEMFSALMHLKVIRAYIDGVLRFGIEPKFMIGVVLPKKGTEKKILQEMTEALAEVHLKEMYGEKIDASEADDYWPFVCISLTSPTHLFSSIA